MSLRAWYEERLFNPLMDRALRAPAVSELRSRLLRDAHGDVVEIGLGTGLNLPHYARGTRVRAIVREPELDARALRRADEADIELEHVRGDAQSIPLPDRSVERLVCTFVLCSVDDPARAWREFARVLAPGGRLFVIEHVLSPRSFERRVQRALTPVHRLYACGCELDRDLRSLAIAAGFDARELVVDRTTVFPFPASELLVGRSRHGASSARDEVTDDE